MKREFLKELGLEDETIDKIMAEHGKTVNEYKDKADKADTYESQIDDLNKQIQDRDSQLEKLQEKAKDNKSLSDEIANLKQQNEDDKKEYEQKIQQQKKASKLELALKDAKARNPKAVKALIDDEKVSLDESDNLIGLKEQLESLQESDDYLFEQEEQPGLSGRQPHPGNSGAGGNNEDNPFTADNLNLTEQGRLINNEPDKAKQFIQQAGQNPANFGL